MDRAGRVQFCPGLLKYTVIIERRLRNEAKKDLPLTVFLVRKMFIMPVKTGGEWHSTESLAAGLRSVQFGLSTLPVVPVSERVCALTASSRDKWSHNRDLLMQSKRKMSKEKKAALS